jgi:N-acetylglucosaminyl-diphospho-decaprenol L-rhamnosyltransferase
MDLHLCPPLVPTVVARRSEPLPARQRYSRSSPSVTRLTPRLSVVIVNYQHWEDTASLVRQLHRCPCLRDGRAEVVVVDNHSPTHPIVGRMRRLDHVSLRRWKRNRGFARAVNEGTRLSRGDWVLLLNPDMTLPPGFLDTVLRRADALAALQPRAGIIGFRLRHEDGSRQLSTGNFPTLARTLLGLLLPRATRKYNAPPLDGPSPVDWVTGCCLLVRRDCWDDLGGLDPEYFLYYEDVDLCRRARAQDWSVWFDPGVSAIHHRPLHVRSIPPLLRTITRHALLSYARNHWPHWQFRLLAGIVRYEAFSKRIIAQMMGDATSATLCEQLVAIVGLLEQGRVEDARRRLLRIVWGREQLPGSRINRDPQTQPA